MAENSRPQLPVPKRPNWLLFCTGGLLTTSGLGWCLRHAYAEEPKMALATYMVGSVGVVLSNLAYRPAKRGSTSNLIFILTGGILSGAGFGYCLTLAMKEHPKSSAIAYAVGSLGYLLVNSSVYAATVSKIIGRKTESRYSKIELSPNWKSHVLKIAKNTLDEDDDVCRCQICTTLVEREKAGKECEREPCLSIGRDFQQKMQEYNLEINQSVNTSGNTRSGIYRIADEENDSEKLLRKREIEEYKWRDETTQTESRLRVMGTQTQESDLVWKKQGKIEFSLSKGLIYEEETGGKEVN